MKRVSLALALLLPFPLDGPAGGQPSDPPVVALAAGYAAERAAAGGFVADREAVARALQAGAIVIEIVPGGASAGATAAAPLPGARQLPLSELFAPEELAALGGSAPVLVTGVDPDATVEAMVLLRLAGIPALAVRGGPGAVVAARSGDPEAPAGPVGETGEVADATATLGTSSSPWSRDVVTVAVAAGAVMAAILFTFLVLLPWWRRRPLRRALAILEADREQEFGETEGLLRRALTAGLRPRGVALAGFCLAYVLARLERYSEAVAALGGLPGKIPRQPEDLYLELWLQARLEAWEEVERLVEVQGGRLGDLLDTRLISGLAFLHQGRAHMARKETERALYCFRRLKKLGVLADALPADIDDHQVVLGIQALHEREIGEAEERFEGARQAAEEEGKSTLQARIGLLLCAWRQTDYPDLDEELGELAGELTPARPAGGEARPAGEEGEQEAPEAVAAADEAAEGEPAPETDEKLDEAELLLRDVRLWYAVSRVFLWFRLPEKQGLPPAELEELRERAAKVLEVDPTMSDPSLLAGLIGYYFAADDAERAAAVGELEEAIEREVRVPEIRYLVAQEQKLAVAAADSLRDFLGLVRRYLEDGVIPYELRQRLRARLSALQRFRELGEVDLVRGEVEAAPSLRDLQARSELVRRRMGRIVLPELRRTRDEAGEAVQRMLEALEREATALSETAKQLESTEHELLVVAGEFLLREEDGPPAGGDETGGETAGSG